MKSKFLLSVSAIVLVGLLGAARADDAIDATAVALAAVYVGVPADAFTNATQKAVTDAVNAVNAVETDQKNISTLQATAAAAQKDVSTKQAAYDSLSAQYQAATQSVVDAKANLDQVIATYKNSTPQQVLTDATRSLNILKQSAIDTAKTLAAYSKMPDSDQGKKDAVTANNDAQNLVQAAQIKANRAGDIAQQANVTSATLIAAAQQNYDTVHKVLGDAGDTNGLNYKKLAAQQSWNAATTAAGTASANVTAAQATLLTDQGSRTQKVVTATNDVNIDALAYQNKPVQPPAVAAPPVAAKGTQTPGSVTTPPALAVTGGSTPPALADSGTPAISAPALLVTAPVISNDGGSALPPIKSGDSLLGEYGNGLLSEHGGGAVATSGAGLTSATASALVANLPASALISNAPMGSNAFKQDSTISAFTNIDTSTPSDKWQKAVGNLSKADQQALSDLKAAIAKSPSMQLSQAQVDLVSKVTKSLDTQTVQSLEQGVAQKVAVATKTASLNQAVTTMVVNNAITDGKSDPQVASAVLKVASGKTPTASETQHVNDVVAKAVDKLPLSANDKKAWQKRTHDHVAAVVAPPPPKTAVIAQPATPPLSQDVVNQFISAGPAVIAGLKAQQDAALKAGNTTLAAGLAADIVNVQATIDQAKQQAAAAAPVQITTSSSSSVTPVSLTSQPSNGPAAKEQTVSTRSGRDSDRSASTNREREPERSANTRQDFIPEHSPTMRREQEHEREANTRREREHEREANTRRDFIPEHSPNMHHEHERAREANRHHEGLNPANRQRPPSATARATTTYTAASAPKAPPAPKTPPAVAKVPPPPTLPPRH